MTRLRISILVALAVATLLTRPGMALAASPSPRYVVSYLVSAADDSSAQVEDEAFPDRQPPSHPWHWRVFDPLTGRDTLFLVLESFPTRVRWDPAFRFVEFALANRIERATWHLGARVEEQARLPLDSCLCDFWSDSTSRWHVITQLEVEEHPKPGYSLLLEFATRWDQDGERWRAAARDSAVGQYGSCLPWKRLTEETSRPAAVVLRDLLDSMRIVRHNMTLLRRFPTPPDDETYPCLVWEPYKADSTIGIEMRSEMGDEDHAMEPVVWVDKKHKRRITVCGRGGTHNDAFGQIAFAQRGRFLLVAAEYSGAYPIVADMRTGRVIFRVSRPSARAVWVPAPK